jgi:hypothetical protein
VFRYCINPFVESGVKLRDNMLLPMRPHKPKDVFLRQILYPSHGFSDPSDPLSDPSDPLPVPAKTRTLSAGTGFWRVRVRVALNYPRVTRDNPYARVSRTVPCLHHWRGKSLARASEVARVCSMLSKLRYLGLPCSAVPEQNSFLVTTLAIRRWLQYLPINQVLDCGDLRH